MILHASVVRGERRNRQDAEGEGRLRDRPLDGAVCGLAQLERHGPAAACVVDDTAYPEWAHHSVGVAPQ